MPSALLPRLPFYQLAQWGKTRHPMIRDYSPSVRASAPANQTNVMVWAWLLGVLLILAAMALIVRVDSQLAQASQDLSRISASLDNLNAMNRELDRLDDVHQALSQLNFPIDTGQPFASKRERTSPVDVAQCPKRRRLVAPDERHAQSYSG